MDDRTTSTVEPEIPSHAMCRLAGNRAYMSQYLSGEELEQSLKRWTPEKAQAMSEDEILAKLDQLGFPLDYDQVEPLTWEFSSGWELADELRPPSLKLPAEDEDFPGLAVVELWKRWFPDHPCVEAIDDWINNGFETTDGLERLEHWLKAWEEIRKRAPEIGVTVEAIDQALLGSIQLTEWLTELMVLLRNLTLNGLVQPDIGISLSSDLLRIFPSHPDIRSDTLRDLGYFYYAAGNLEAGDNVFAKLVDEEQNSASPRLSQCYALLEAVDGRLTPEIMTRIDNWVWEAKCYGDARQFGIEDLCELLEDFKNGSGA